MLSRPLAWTVYKHFGFKAERSAFSRDKTNEKAEKQIPLQGQPMVGLDVGG